MNGPQLLHKYRSYYQWKHFHCQKKTIRCHLMRHLINHWMIKSNFCLLSYFFLFFIIFLLLMLLVVQFSFPFFWLLLVIVDLAYTTPNQKKKKKTAHIQEMNIIIIIMLHIFNFVIVLLLNNKKNIKYFRDDCMIRIHGFLHNGKFEHAVIMLRSAR